MTELLRKAVATLSELPPEKQDALATMVLEEIACEQGPSRPLLSIEALEEEARLEYLAGKTEPGRVAKAAERSEQNNWYGLTR